MPIAQVELKTVKTITKEPVATLNDPEFKSVTTDSRESSYSALMTNIGGSRWIVDYYSQQLGDNDELMSYDPAKDAVYQQYIKTKNLELKVDSSLSQSQDKESREITVTGTSVLYGNIVPNIGDLFTADIGDGRVGLFTVTESTRLTILKETCYSIDYTLMDYLTTEIESDLDKKTVRVDYFIKALLSHGEKPIVVAQDYQDFLSLDEMESVLLNRYLELFYDRRVSTVVVPTTVGITYDPFIVTFIKSFIETDKHRYLRHMKSYSVTLPELLTPTTLWDSLLNVDGNTLDLVSRDLGILDTSYWSRSPQYGGIFYTDITDVVYPTDKLIISGLDSIFKSSNTIVKAIETQFPITQLDPLTNLLEPKQLNIKPVTVDNSYVFSTQFYTGKTEEMSKLELLVYNAITKLTVDRSTLLALGRAVKTWGDLEQFYYTPILLLLIKLFRHGL